MMIFIFLLYVWLICAFSRTLPRFCVVKVSSSQFHLSISRWARAARREAICLTISASLSPSCWFDWVCRRDTHLPSHTWFVAGHFSPSAFNSPLSSLNCFIPQPVCVLLCCFQPRQMGAKPCAHCATDPVQPGMACASWLWRSHFVCPPVAIGLEGNLACWFWSEEWSVHLSHLLRVLCEEWDGQCTWPFLLDHGQELLSAVCWHSGSGWLRVSVTPSVPVCGSRTVLSCLSITSTCLFFSSFLWESGWEHCLWFPVPCSQ